MLKYAYPYQTPETKKLLLCMSGSPEDSFSTLKKLGYDGVELLIRNPKELDMREFETLVNSSQLEIAGIGTGPIVADDGLTYTSEKEEVRQEATERTKQIIEWGANFNCPISIGKLRGQLNFQNQIKSWELMKDSFHEVLNYAEKLNVSILIEPQNPSQLNNLTKTDETLSFISKFKSDSLGIMLDTLHMHAEEKNPLFPALFKEAKNQLGFIHLTDSNRLPPGNGDFDMKEILRTLELLPNCPYISLEVNQQGKPLETAHNSLTYLKKLMTK